MATLDSLVPQGVPDREELMEMMEHLVTLDSQDMLVWVVLEDNLDQLYVNTTFTCMVTCMIT